MALGTHVDVYKVCGFNGCYSSDIVAGIDDAMVPWTSSPSLSGTSPFHSSRTSSPSVASGRQSEALSSSAPPRTMAPWQTSLPTRHPMCPRPPLVVVAFSKDVGAALTCRRSALS
ncbi:Subtilisin-like protease SBT1.2 [Canna indica]|uniref:Subtilisin-like protease SBT1.2 n=1 Tax=Canna indica TaxID=4628 RepID=A0AAQ3QCG0_9LILI|nr:Subtilisin-like protease SBT1.2 [Canna indica]